MSWAKNGAPIEWPPVPPVPQSLVAPFEAFHGKSVGDMTDHEKLTAARVYLAASLGEQNEMTPHLVED
jgi:hypothetical protein